MRKTRLKILSAIEALVHVHEVLADLFTNSRSVLLSSLELSAGEMAEAVARRAGDRKVGTITWEQDEEIQRINDSWPDSTRSEQAEKMGFGIDRSIDEIIDGFIEDDMEAQLRILA